ncbi:MAG: hypothetical protein P1Q69_04495 [Candidatus Thorarchaeota archaeon]|nr:hypothetical protein [Candidatus Thorarchaeota archaeon]
MRGAVAIAIMIVCLFVSTPLVGSQELSIESVRTHEVAYSSVSRDVEFQLSKSFEASNTITHPDFAPRSAQDVVDSIDTFLPEGVERVTKADVYHTDVSITISWIHIIEDREFGAGSTFLNILLNDDETYHDYIFDNDGSYYVGNDGDYLSVDIELLDSIYSMNGWFLLTVHGWEADPDIGWPDDYMGGENYWVDLVGRTSFSISGWMALDEFSPIGGTEPVQMEIYISVELTDIEVMTYPDDFSTPYDGSWLISNIYFPKLYYDTFDFAHNVLIDSVYQQVYYGYDAELGQSVYLIYYLFYWEKELDAGGVLFGHYYDYEPLLMFVTDIGEEPYRIVYRDVGASTLPPKMVVHDLYEASSSGLVDVNVSIQLMPLLGDGCNVTYEITDLYFTEAAYHYRTTHGITPYMEVPYITITNTYHQMEVGVPLGSGEAVVNLNTQLKSLSDEVIGFGYALLDEAFDSPINVYEGVNLFGGGDYRVPDNMSLTYDMLHNPFVFPYIVDCWEDVVHYTEASQEYVENGFYYDIDFGLTFTVPATVTLSVPTSVTRGESYDVTVDLALTSNDIIITFDYDISLGFVLNWWFIGLEEEVTYDGSIELAVDLDAISDMISALGFSGESLTGDYKEGWFTVSDFATSPNLLSTMLDCTVEIHLLRILSDLLGTTGIGKVIDLLKLFVDDVNLIAHPTVSGFMTSDIVTDNSAITLDKSSMTFAESTTHHKIEMDVLSGSTQTSSGIKLSNMQYHLAFATDWDVEFDFTDTMNNFVDDAEVDVGTFPDITESSDEHEVTAETTTGYDQKISMTVADPVLPISTTSTTTTGTTGGTTTGTGTTTGPPAGGEMPMDLILTLSVGLIATVVVIVVGVLFLKKRSGTP